MRLAREDALRTLEGLIPLLEQANRFAPGAWWGYLISQVAVLEHNEITGPALGRVPKLDLTGPGIALWSSDTIPPTISEWGSLSYAWIRWIRDLKDHTQSGLPSNYMIQSHPLFKGSQGSESVGTHQRAQGLYVIPMVTWLEAEVRAYADLEGAIERWCRRVALFGLDSVGREDVDEDALQRALHCFLFDMGLEPHRDVDREVQTGGRGRMDFLLRGQELVPVEVKLWRGTGKVQVQGGARQARTYAASSRSTSAYVVIVNAAADKRLSAPDTVDFGDGSPVLRVRVVDPWPPAPSKDTRETVSLSAMDFVAAT